MERMLSHLLEQYEERAFVLRLKVRFIAYCYLTELLAISAAIIYTGYANLNNPLTGYMLNFKVLGPLMGGLAVTMLGFVILARGHYTAAAHLLLLCGFALVWTVIFFDHTHIVARLDTIVLIVGLLSMTPIVILKRPLGIVFYGMANIMLLYTFMFLFREVLNLPYSSFISYLSDNTITILAVTSISYQVYSINRQALEKAERDISERKKAEDALKEAEQRLRAIFDLSVGFIGLLTPGGNVIEANLTALEFTGTHLSDIIGKPFWETPWWSHSVDMQEQLRAAVWDAARGEFVRFEATHTDTDSLLHIIDFSLKPIKDDTGKVILLIPEGRDITERKRAEEALRESEERFKILFEKSLDAQILIDHEGKVVDCNDAFVELFYLQGKPEVLGHTPVDFAPIFQLNGTPSSDEGNKILTAVLEKGSARCEWVHQKHDPAHTPILTELSCTLIQIANCPMIHVVIRDITARKQAEEALRESEEKYRLIAENTADLISILDMNLHFTYVSPASMRLRGFTVEEAMEQTLEQVLTPESMRLALTVFEEEMQLEASGTADPDRTRILEVEEYRKDGSTVWVEVNLSFLRDKDGKPVKILIVTRDITERKGAEEESRKLSSVVRHSRELVNLATPDGTMIFLNDAGKKMLGMSEEDVAQANIMKVIPEHLQDKVQQEVLPSTIRDGYWEGDLQYLNVKTGGLTDVHAITFKIADPETGTLQFLANVSLDITERKQAEEALRKSEEMLRLITDNMSDMIRVTDLRGVNLYTSPSHFKGLGYKMEERAGKSAFDVVHPDDRERIINLFEEGITAKRRVNVEYRVRHADGHYVWLETVGDSLRDTQGNVTSVVMSSRDISDRKQVEEEKRTLERRLQHTDKMEAIGTLAGGIAHDFNNLLMGIQGYTSLSLMNLDPFNPNYERLKRIEEQVQSGADLTRQLLGFASGGRYEVKPADMNYIIEKTSSMFGRTKKEITLHKKYGKDLRTVEVDRGQMKQVFLNLYVNAWQAMPGGGEIYLETENVILDDEQAFPHTIKPGKYVKITVTDTGTGMDEKTRERIFDPFFTTKEMGRGTGLGLATVYGIIKGHKGMINVYSEPGHGTTFTIYLPASEKEVVKEETATGEIARGTETILLVDDEKMVLEVNKELLESMGYRVYAVGSGQEAVAVYMEKRKKIDLVILDMIMPGTSGGKTFDRLREINPGIKVLLSSGYSLNGEAQTIMDRGCNGFLQKPFQVQQLSSKVRAMLD